MNVEALAHPGLLSQKKEKMFVTRRYNVEPSGRTVQDTHSNTSRLRVGIPKGQRILFGTGTAVALRWPAYLAADVAPLPLMESMPALLHKCALLEAPSKQDQGLRSFRTLRSVSW